MKKRVLISGITGQDGSYLAELLLRKNYEVWGMARRSSTDGHLDRLKNVVDNQHFHLIYADITDKTSLENIFSLTEFDECYNLCAQSQVAKSFKMPEYTEAVNWHGMKSLIDLVQKHNPDTKFYQASTSELFGNAKQCPQDEQTPMKPVSPYAEAKLKAHNYCQQKRQEGMFACNGILFNHESERRSLEFITQKVCNKVVEIYNRVDNVLVLGNMNAERDWGYAVDYVEAMWLMLQQTFSDDYVISTGETRSIRNLIDTAFEVINNFAEKNISYAPVNLSELNEGDADLKIGWLKNRTWNNYVVSHPKFYRPNEVHLLKGNSNKAKELLGWKPKVEFDQMIRKMIVEQIKK